MAGTSFPLVRGRTMRATRLNGCGVPLTGAESSIAVTDGYVSVALTAEINEPEEVAVVNANGQTCVRDPGCAEFKGYNVEIVFCNVDPCLFSMVTGQQPVLNAAGEPIGFRMNSKVKACDNAYALEVWAGSPGAACQGQTAESGSFGYFALPFLRAGVVGDFTIENSAITFTITGSVTLDGNAWGLGPYNVMEVNGSPAKLHEAVDPNDHLVVVYTTLAPPDSTEGYCLTDTEYTAFLADGTLPPTKSAAQPGDVFPAEATITASDAPNAAELAGLGFVADPTTAWTTGQKITVGTFDFNWSGTAWAAGAHA